jgi:hypothetical protein
VEAGRPELSFFDQYAPNASRKQKVSDGAAEGRCNIAYVLKLAEMEALFKEV